MAVFYVTHHEYPDNPQVFVSDLKQIVQSDSDGEHLWQIILYTSGKDQEGEDLGPYWINVYSGVDTLDELIGNKISEICEEIDWTRSWYDTGYEQKEDIYPPKIVWQYPTAGQIDVPIQSTIVARVRDPLPSKGIDLSSIYMKINGITITPKVTGHKYDCVVSFRPQVGS